MPLLLKNVDGLAKRGQGERKAIVGLDQTGTRFLCRSRFTQITSSARWRPLRDAYVGS